MHHNVANHDKNAKIMMYLENKKYMIIKKFYEMAT